MEAKGKRLGSDLFSANITPDPSGIAYYTDSLFIETLRTGAVRARRLDGVMPWTVFRNMRDEDLSALFAYLRAQPPVRHIVDNHQPHTPCAMCGQEHGEGEYNLSKFETFRRLEVDSLILAQFEGRYQGDIYSMVFRREGRRLVGELDGKRVEMAPGPDTLFYARELPGPMSFTRDRNGQVTHMVAHEDKEHPARKVE